MTSLRYSISAIVESRPLKILVVHPALKSQVYHMKTNSQNFEKKRHTALRMLTISWDLIKPHLV